MNFHRYRLFILFCLLAFVLVGMPAFLPTHAQENLTIISIENDLLVPNAKRLGINLGKPDQFGAEQIMQNVILNPGFEAGEFATIIHVAEGATGNRIQQDNWEVAWNSPLVGQPEGFWNGAEYEFVTGAATGRTGIVSSFNYEDGLYTYHLDSDGLVPQAEDALFLRQIIPGYEGDRYPYNVADTETLPPDTPGTQSLKLLPPDEDWRPSFTYFMDSYWRDGDASAGQLFKVEGNWHLEFWVKGSEDGDSLEAYWERGGITPFFTETFTTTTTWRKVSYDFFVPPNMDSPNFSTTNAGNPVLTFAFRIHPDQEPVWVDDVVLSRLDYQNPTVFTDRFVHLLKELNPGIVRDWGNQLGSSLDNQLAPPHARKPTAHSPRDQYAYEYQYSLHEFLELAEELGAEPWYVIPPTFSLGEMENLIAYLAAPVGSHPYADKRLALGRVAPWTATFPMIHLEYGNEMWGGNAGNDNFIGATARGGQRLGEMSTPRFQQLKSSPFYDPARFNLIVGGQFASPFRQFELSTNSLQHDTIALAPYFGDLDHYQTNEDIFQPLFARPLQDVTTGKFVQSRQFMVETGSSAEFAIYEINFHSTVGGAPLSVRNGFVTGQNGALSLPLYMLTYQRDLGIRNQATFTALQFSFQMTNGEYTRLWGMLRDIEGTGIKRPTWLGVELANRAVRGDMVKTIQRGLNPTWLQQPINGITEEIEVPYLQSFAFRDGDSFAMVLFNLHLTEAQEVALEFPTEVDRSAILHSIETNNIHNNNEGGQVVNIQTKQLPAFEQGYRLRLSPHSVHVVEWGVPGKPPMFIAPTVTPLPAITPLPTATFAPPTIAPMPLPTPTPAIVEVEVPVPVQGEVPLFVWGLMGAGGLVLMVGAWLAARMKYRG